MTDFQLIRIRCTNCGADFDSVREDQQIFSCTRFGCGATFRISQGKAFYHTEKEKAAKIANHRAAMTQALRSYQFDAVLQYASVIIGLIPTDFRANAAQQLAHFKAREGDSRALREYLSSFPAVTETEFSEMLPYFLDYCGYDELIFLLDLLPRYSAGAALTENNKLVFNRLKEIETENEAYADIKRDVFLCCSDADGEIAREAADALAGDGRLVWLRSRNLSTRSANPPFDIGRAVKKCRVFVVVSSHSAMMSKNVQREIGFAEDCGIARIEFKIDAHPHTQAFKQFFEGLVPIDASGNLSKALDALKKQVAEQLVKKIEEDSSKPRDACDIPESRPPHTAAEPDDPVLRKVRFINQLENALRSALDFVPNRYRRSLTRLLEDVSYSDPMSPDTLAASEAELKSEIEALCASIENGECDDLESRIRRASILLKRRNDTCRIKL